MFAEKTSYKQAKERAARAAARAGARCAKRRVSRATAVLPAQQRVPRGHGDYDALARIRDDARQDAMRARHACLDPAPRESDGRVPRAAKSAMPLRSAVHAQARAA